MHTKNQISLTRKSLYGIMLIAVFVAAFGAGNLPSVQAQEMATVTPPTPEATITSSNSLEDTFWIGYNAGRWILPKEQQPSIAFTDQMDAFGIIWVGLSDTSTNQLLQIPSIPIPAILGQDDSWLLSYPGESDYEEMLLQMPNNLIPASVLAEFIPPDLGAQTAQNAGYYPWHGSIKVTQDRQNPGGSHYPGGSDEWAWDFGNGTSGWPIYASRGGRIAWINTSHETNSGCSSCDWTTANVIVIDFGDGYAAIYMHLAKEWPQRFSINQQVNTGDLIGYADQTGKTSASHLHFALQGWDSSWNGNPSPSIWYRHSQESLFNDETPYGNPGNPTYPNWYTSHVPSGGGGSCPGPSLNSPNDGYVSSGQTITFSWSALSGCTFNGYTFRVNDSSNMDDSPIIDTGEGGTSRTETIGTQWNNRDMWWGVKAANAPNGASWSVRRFRIEPGSSNCNPNSDQIALFEHGNYGGTCKIFGIGDYADPGAMGFPNDAASSIKVGSNVKAILYEHAGYGGASEEFSGDDSDFGNNTIGHDRVSSIKVQSRGCNPNSDQISLYAGTSYTGACVTLGIGVYPDPGYLGAVGNDNAESVRVGSNVEAVLCEHDNYQGTCSTLSSDEINLGNHPIGGNRVSSVKVQTRAPAGDGYEPDGDSGQANWISSGSPQNHSIVPATDTDWGKFQLDATSAITLETSGSTGSGTRMWLYDSNLNELEYSDDEGTDYYSYIDRSCGVDALAAGTYYVKVDEYGNNDEISSYNLSFNVTATCAPPTPSNFHVSATTTDSITLGWDDVSGETGYNIYKWGYDGTNWTFIYYASVGADVTTYTDTNLPCGNDFNYYELSAYNGIGESNHVGWVQGTTDACPSSELNITSLSYYPGTAYANDDIWVKVEIQNSSNVNASGFWIDVYVDHQPTACDEWGGYYIWVDGLAANSTDFWWIEVPAGDLAASTYNIYAFVDSGCQVSENDENNNIAGPTSLALLTPPPAPVHDDFDAARLISPLPYTDTVDVTGAWRAWDDPSVSTCDLAPGLASVWYKYTPSSNTRLSLDTFGSDYDTYIAVWTGSRGNLSLVGCNDDTPGSYQSALQVNLTAGTTYFIEIAEWNGSITSLAMDTSMRNRPRPGENGSSGLSVGKASSITPKPTSEVGALAGGSLQFHVLPMPALTVSKSGTGSGTVTSSPAGINCGSTCSYAFANNTIVTLTASPTSPSTFGGWSGGGCSGTGTCIVTLSSAQSVTATFNYPNQTLTVGKTGTGNGTVTSSPSGINCGSDCSETYSYNTSVTLTASVSSGSTFTGWSGAGCSGTGTCTVTMTAAASVTANFTLNTYTLFLPLILR